MKPAEDTKSGEKVGYLFLSWYLMHVLLGRLCGEDFRHLAAEAGDHVLAH